MTTSTTVMMRLIVLALGLVTSSAACGGGRAVNEICERRAACTGADVDTCVAAINAGIDDGRYDPDDVEPCAECLKDSSCAEIAAGACDTQCGSL